MDQIGSSGKARRDARCGASGERRNTAGGPIWPTEGRVLLRRGVVAFLVRYTASPCETRLATTQNHPGQMVPYGQEPL